MELHDPDSVVHEHDGAFDSSALIQSELARVTRSKSFQQSRRHQKLLRHLVEQVVAGNTGALKEPLLAVEVFERPLHAFDPARDTIVRVEARRLRQRLARYYVTEGSDAVFEIRLPVGSYVPTLSRRDVSQQAATRRARDLTERGEHFLRQPLSQETLEAALQRFDAALRESPAHVAACVGIGRAWFNLATGWYREPRIAAEHAAEALRKAVALDPRHAIAHVLLGATQHQFEHDWTGARRNFERAAALAPHDAFVHSAYGWHLALRGELALAERHLLLARRLDPHYANTRMHMVNLRIAQGRLDDADAELDGMRDLAPDNMAVCGMAGLLAMLRGDARRALEHYRRVCELAPDHPNAHASLAAAQGFAGQHADADATLALAKARFGADALSPYVLAVVAARCGRPDDAFAHLDDALTRADPSAMLLRTDASFAGLRDDPRFAALVERLAGPRQRARRPSHGSAITP